MDQLETLVERVTSRRGPNHRTAIWAVLALIAGVLAITAIPANATDGGESALGVHPVNIALGGQPNDCTATIAGRLPSAATNELRIQNPQNGGMYSGPGGVSITLAVRDGDKKLDFALTGPAVVFDVIVKGGQKSTHYDYDTNGGPGGTTADQNLHAPTKGQGLFSISHVSFCYQEAFAASGTVYVDANKDGDLNSGEVADSPRVVTAYDSNSVVASTTSAADGTYTLYLPPGGSFTICEAADTTVAQTEPVNNKCEELGASEFGGHDGITAITVDLDFGHAPEICGLDEPVTGFGFDGAIELFTVGNFESPCLNKFGELSVSDEVTGPQINLPLSGSGYVAGIGVITKDFGSTAFVPLEYAQSETDDFDVLPWCELRTKMPPPMPGEQGDGDQFDPYIDNSMYPSLVDVFDDPGTDLEPSVSCKVHVAESAEGLQTTVVLIQDDPFWR